MIASVILITVIAVAVIAIFLSWVSRYKKCPSDKVLVVYGKTKGDNSARIIQGGAVFIWPVIQDFAFLDLKPIAINIQMKGALSKQNIRINIHSNFTIAISKESSITLNAANRLLGMKPQDIQHLAEDLITGQMRLVVATMDIEQINTDRETFLKHIQTNVEVELNKVGLTLLNVNISDIQDESNYIASLGKEAASKALNEAKVSVAQKDRDGAIGEAEANKEKQIKVSEFTSTADIGKANAEAAAAEGKNLAAIKIAESNSNLAAKQSEAEAKAKQASNIANANAEKLSYKSQQEAEEAKAEKVRASLKASTIVPAEIEKEKISLQAEATAEVERRTAKGKADGILANYEAEAEGIRKVLNARAEGYKAMVASIGSAEALAQVLMIEKMENIAKINAEAIKNIKFDKITVWDSGNSTGNFLQGLLTSLPPLKELFNQAGTGLPALLAGNEAAPGKTTTVAKTPLKPEA